MFTRVVFSPPTMLIRVLTTALAVNIDCAAGIYINTHKGRIFWRTETSQISKSEALTLNDRNQA